MLRPPPSSPLFPYTTLFRSRHYDSERSAVVAGRPSRSIPPAPRRSQDLPLRGRRHRGSSPSVLGSCHYDRRGQGNSSLRGANFASSTRELTLAQVGFVHCAFEEQVAGVANSFFRGVAKLVVLRISIDKLNAEVRYEDLEGGKVLFLMSMVRSTSTRSSLSWPFRGGGMARLPSRSRLRLSG